MPARLLIGPLAAAALCAVASLLVAEPAAAGSPGHSLLVPLPTVSPPPVPGRPMRWARVPPDRRAAKASAFGHGRAVVGLADGVSGATIARATGLRVVAALPGLRAVVLGGTPRNLAGLAALRDPRIRYVDPVRTMRDAHARDDPLTLSLDPVSRAPYQWAFRQVGLDRALNLTRGDPRILVGVVDSGISAVPDLRGKVAETFWDPAVNASAADTRGHGTFVSSIIASRNDDGFGLAGFCGACRVAVFKAVPLTDVQLALGIQRLTDAHVRVINLSIVSQSVSQAIIDALNYAKSAGVLVVAASGNEGFGTIDFPASYVQPPDGGPTSGLAVGAVDARGNRAGFSNWGSQLSLVAPGSFDARCNVGIIGALPAVASEFDAGHGCVTPLPETMGRYAYASGTSFAAPEVAGIAALLWSVQPGLSSTEVAALLTETAVRAPGAGWNSSVGWGIVDARAAIERLTGSTTADGVTFANLRVKGRRVAGAALEATVRATWRDGMPVTTGATPRCRIAVRGKRIASKPSVKDGVLRCAFTLPRGAAGARVNGRVWLTARATPPAVALFELTARPPPAAAVP